MTSHDNLHITVLLVGNYPHDRQESMQRFAKVLARELPKCGIKVETCDPAPHFGRLRPSASGLGKWLGYIDKFIIFPCKLRTRLAALKKERGKGGAAFLVHICDHSNAIYTRYLHGIPHLVTCNDLLAIRSAHGEIRQNITRRSGRWLQRFILGGLNRADRVACISHATSRDLLRLSHLSHSRVKVIYMGQNHSYQPLQPVEARAHIAQVGNLHADSYILHVGGNHWYKNRVGVLAVYAALLRVTKGAHGVPFPKLVMVGPAPTQEMTALLKRQPELDENVVLLQDVGSECLEALYSAAELLLFPSLEEGFGWPIAEAQACGCRVVATGKAPMTEVGGDAAVYLDPADVSGEGAAGFERAARIVAELLHEEDGSKQSRIVRGLQNAERFLTAEMIRQYVETYQELTAQPAVINAPDRTRSVTTAGVS